MTTIKSSATGCGNSEMHYLRKTPLETIKDVFLYFEKRGWTRNSAFMIFSDKCTTPRAKKKTNGQKIAQFITDNKLGEVIQTNRGLNKVHRSKVAIWVWELDHKAIQKFAKSNGWEYVKPKSQFSWENY
jgi:hypothetical protein